MTRDRRRSPPITLAESKPGGGGTNVVNVILVDFRGFDTFGEIIVLGIAALAIFALLDSALRGAAARGSPPCGRANESARRASDDAGVATRVLLPLALMVGVYIFLRGHNLPGGGFIAGLVVAIAFSCSTWRAAIAWAHQRARIDAQAMIGGGVLIAGA
jgi:multicomponent K+:H+ antiporter subunit A